MKGFLEIVEDGNVLLRTVGRLRWIALNINSIHNIHVCMMYDVVLHGVHDWCGAEFGVGSIDH